MQSANTNIELKELSVTENIDRITLLVCTQNKLTDLQKILNFKNKNANFLSLEYSNSAVNQKLLSICEKYENWIEHNTVNLTHNEIQNEEQETVQNTQNYTLEFLCDIENLGVRGYNACKFFNLLTLKDLIDFYNANGDFLKVRNCGKKSNEELITICKKYEKYFISETPIHIDENPKNPIIQRIEKLTVRQKKIVNNSIATLFNELSVRASNVLNNHLDYDISLNGLSTIYEDESFKFSNLRNAGKQTISEIQDFIDEIKENIELITLFEDENELIIELFNSFLKRKFNISAAIFSEIGTGYDYSRGLPIFKTLNVLIENEILFDSREKVIIKHGFNYFNNTQTKFLQDIASNLKITRERTRQIRKIIFDNLNNSLSFIKSIELEAYNIYGIDVNSDLILIEDELVTEINAREKNSFNNLFINKIFSILLSETTELIGNEENIVFRKNINSSHNWNSSYLVKRELTVCFDFMKFIEDVSLRLSQRIEEDYNFHFETYLQDFKKKEATELSERITFCAEQILFNEFEISLDIHENIIFKRNTKKQVIEYVIDVLEEKNEPMTVYEIYDIIKSRTPEITKNAEALRGTCQRDARLIYFGRSSTYGLKEWEEDLNIKGGTIRDIAEEFLMKYSEPKHIDDITDFVNMYRNTNAKNIYANLKMEENNRFEFYTGLKIGLKNKNNNETNLIKTDNIQVERKTWDESFNQLLTFAQNNNRLPYSSGNELEQRLYRFMNVQLNKAGKGKIEQEKALLIKGLVEKYSYRKRKRINPKRNDTIFDELEKFIVEKERLPRANYEDEKRLYHFLFRQNKQFKNGNLTGEQLNKYLKIKNLLKAII